MDKLHIPLNGGKPGDIPLSDVIYSVPWNALMPTIEQFVRLRPDEMLTGLIIDEISISAVIGRKRKNASKKGEVVHENNL